MTPRRVILISTAAPDRPYGSMVRYTRMIRFALEQHAGDRFEVGEIQLAPAESRLARFPARLRTPLRYAIIAANARRMLPHAQAELLHLLDGSHAYLLGATSRLAVPLVITVHDLIPFLCMLGRLGEKRPGILGGRLIRYAMANLARADAWGTGSSNTRKDLVELAGVPAERVLVVPDSVELAGGDEPAPPPVATPYILHVAGNNTFYKNRPGVIDVFRSVRQSCPVRLVMAGAPPDAELLRKVQSSGVADAVEFRTNLPDTELTALYRRAAVLLFPSFYEGFGRPPLEAMLRGCPVVCSNAGSLAEVAGDAALSAPPGDTAALAAHVVNVLQDSALRQRLIEKGFRHVQRFSSSALAVHLAQLYAAADAAFGRRMS